MNYTLSQWDALTVFTTDGAVPIDNNVSEREMKRVVLNRKNSLFVGNPRGGRFRTPLSQTGGRFVGIGRIGENIWPMFGAAFKLS